MRYHKLIGTLFWIAAAYDGVLGLAFLVAGPRIFGALAVTPPNHWGYLHFPAALLIVFAIMFVAIARRPALNRNLIPYGMLLKVSYCSVVAWHWIVADIPAMWKPFLFLDLGFLVLFGWAWSALGREGRGA
jgi:hypothetical protein